MSHAEAADKRPRCAACGNELACIVEDDGGRDWFCMLGCDIPGFQALQVGERDGDLPEGVAGAFLKGLSGET